VSFDDLSSPSGTPVNDSRRTCTDTVANLEALAAIAERAGAGWIARDARSLAERLRGSLFYLACVGQFKRGKSTLLDALLGETVLPIGVVPITAIATVVRYGPERTARVLLKEGGWETITVDRVEEYVSEIENPENVKGVEAIEVFLPNVFLGTGVCLVDTPVIGSVFELNTAATERFVPHIDAALVVLGADPPISGEELTLVTRIAEGVPDLFFVLNKADRLPDAENEEAKQFASEILERRLNKSVHLFEVSAREELQVKNRSRDWPELVEALEALVQSSRTRIVAGAAERGLARITRSLSVTFAEELDGLIGPIEALEAREQTLARLVSRSEHAVSDLAVLMSNEQRQSIESFERRRQRFVDAILPVAVIELKNSLTDGPSFGPAFRRWAMRHAQEVAARYIHPWLAEEEVNAAAEFGRIEGRFTTMAMEMIEGMNDATAGGLDAILASLDRAPDFEPKSRFQFLSLMHLARPASPFRYLADVAIGLAGHRQAIQNDATVFLGQLFEINSSRVQRDLNDRLSDTRHELERVIRQLLNETLGAARSALERVRNTRQAGSSAVSAEVTRLASIEKDFQTVLQSINS
jgi:hypothetical protein